MHQPDPRAVAETLLAWFARQGRTFPWREERDPYTVLIAEILLRKTRAAAVAAFLPPFLAHYPGIAALAVVPVTELAAELSPLGLGWQRARQLHELATSVLTEFHGEIPAAVSLLQALPGVGRYTAGIVAATSFDVPVPAVDSNVARVVCRVFGLIPSHAEARKSTNVWAQASELVAVHPDRPVQLTWAVLDLAASLCTARKPDCPHCPLRQFCVYGRAALSEG